MLQATIVVLYGGSEFRSTAVETMSIVTHGAPEPRKSYIECFFATASGQVGLRIQSQDQRRIEAFFQQTLSGIAAGGLFITAYASSTFQSNGYQVELETDRVYLGVSS
jgi:hypothetical protein